MDDWKQAGASELMNLSNLIQSRKLEEESTNCAVQKVEGHRSKAVAVALALAVYWIPPIAVANIDSSILSLNHLPNSIARRLCGFYIQYSMTYISKASLPPLLLK
jgi:hypothetical protein